MGKLWERKEFLPRQGKRVVTKGVPFPKGVEYYVLESVHGGYRRVHPLAFMLPDVPITLFPDLTTAQRAASPSDTVKRVTVHFTVEDLP